MTDVHQETLERVLKNTAKERGFSEYQLEVTPTASGGANYSSRLFRGKIITPNQNLKFFAKVAAVGEKFREQCPTDLFFTEQFAYRTLSSIFDKIQDDNAVGKEHRLKMPSLYGYAAEPPMEVVVLEDLASEGFASHDRRVAFEWPYASAAVEQLAILHALSIAMQHNYQTEYEEVKKTLIMKKFEETDKSMMQTVEQMMARSIEMTREDNRERLKTYMTENMDNIMTLFYGAPERPVLAHGDFRMSNTMHRVDETGTCQVIIIDYQTLHLGSVAKDLMYFIFTGTDAGFRRQHYHQLLDHYHQHLSLALNRLNLDPEKVFSKADFDDEIKKNMLLGLAFAVFSLPVVTVEEQHAPPLDGELAIESILTVEASQLCQERLNGVVDDYVRWGII